MFQDNEVGKHWKEVNLMKFTSITDIHMSEQMYTLTLTVLVTTIDALGHFETG